MASCDVNFDTTTIRTTRLEGELRTRVRRREKLRAIVKPRSANDDRVTSVFQLNRKKKCKECERTRTDRLAKWKQEMSLKIQGFSCLKKQVTMMDKN
jgi:hypothetical protein